jgi:hypothetical protein
MARYMCRAKPLIKVKTCTLKQYTSSIYYCTGVLFALLVEAMWLQKKVNISGAHIKSDLSILDSMILRRSGDSGLFTKISSHSRGGVFLKLGK